MKECCVDIKLMDNPRSSSSDGQKYFEGVHLHDGAECVKIILPRHLCEALSNQPYFLYRLTVPSAFNFVLNTHLHHIAFFSLDRIVRSQVLFCFKTSNSALIACCQQGYVTASA
ncbi:uncharacterized protein DS421_1g23900 [Arachis hypogaea]|nr:uncharacterized protein DS421_1g23900 [Arachis hypogaea]